MKSGNEQEILQATLQQKNETIQFTLWNKDIELLKITNPNAYDEYEFSDVNLRIIQQNKLNWNIGSVNYEIEILKKSKIFKKSSLINFENIIFIQKKISDDLTWKFINIKGIVNNIERSERKTSITLKNSTGTYEIVDWAQVMTIDVQNKDKLLILNIQVHKNQYLNCVDYTKIIKIK